MGRGRLWRRFVAWSMRFRGSSLPRAKLHQRDGRARLLHLIQVGSHVSASEVVHGAPFGGFVGLPAQPTLLKLQQVRFSASVRVICRNRIHADLYPHPPGTLANAFDFPDRVEVAFAILGILVDQPRRDHNASDQPHPSIVGFADGRRERTIPVALRMARSIIPIPDTMRCSRQRNRPALCGKGSGMRLHGCRRPAIPGMREATQGDSQEACKQGYPPVRNPWAASES